MKVVRRMGLLARFGHSTFQSARTRASALLLAGLLSGAGSQAPAVTATATNAITTARPAATVPASITPAVAAVLRLAESGVTDEVLIGYIKNVQTPFVLSADTILYLQDLGLSSQVLTAMLNRDSELRAYAPVPTPGVTPEPPAEVVAPNYDTNPPPDVSPYYISLYPYGTWAVVDGIGWCWQPRCGAVNPNWRPYCDAGNWVWSDCGWYWNSSYSWGWAPFHYGRWTCHERCGWVWCPDRTWGPGWVSWRTAGNTCGWAPLPPNSLFVAGRGTTPIQPSSISIQGGAFTPLTPSSIYIQSPGWIHGGAKVGPGHDFGLKSEQFTFVSMSDVTARDLPQRRMSTVEARSAFDRSTIVNNTTVGKNNILVNQGVPVQQVAAATHSQIPQAVVRDQPSGFSPVANTPFSQRNSPVVFRHQPPPVVKPVKAVAQKVDAQHPLVQRQLVPTRMPIRTQSAAASAPTGNNYRTQIGSGNQRMMQQPGQSSASVPQPTAVAPQTMTQVPRYNSTPAVPSQKNMPQVYSPKGQQQAVSSRPMPQSAGVVGRSFTPMPAPGPLK